MFTWLYFVIEVKDFMVLLIFCVLYKDIGRWMYCRSLNVHKLCKGNKDF